MYVVFDGWLLVIFEVVVVDLGVDLVVVCVICLCGVVDLVVVFYENGDMVMIVVLEDVDLDEMWFCDKVVFVVCKWLEFCLDKEVVWCGLMFFVLLYYVLMGMWLIWCIVDVIWNVFGDMLCDFNWYMKCMMFSGVYVVIVLFWFGDESEDYVDIWVFLDCWIENVM